MSGGRGSGARIAVLALLAVLLGTGAAVAAGGRAGTPDPSFGTGGRVVVPLPGASAPSHFGPVAAVAGGRLLVAYSTDRSGYTTVIERRGVDGALDPSFGEGGSVRVRGLVTSLAEDPSGGVLYGGYSTLDRLQPDGAPDEAFDAHSAGALPSLIAKTIVFDAQGRIVVGARDEPGARYHPHEFESAVVRLGPDGQPDGTFGSEGILYLSGETSEDNGQLALLADGSMIVVAHSVLHVSADGTLLPTRTIPLGQGESTLAVFSDGSLAISNSVYRKPGCTVTRYHADGSLDPTFAQGGIFKAPQLADCAVTVTPEGGMLVRGAETAGGETASRLLLLTAAGAPVPSFGNDRSVTVSAPAGASSGASLSIGSLAFGPDGRIVVAGSDGDAVLVALRSNGSVDPAFGNAGSVVQSASLPSLTSPRAIAAEPDGELIVTGITDAGSTQRQAFWMRFSADGRLVPDSSGAPFRAVPTAGTELRPAGSKYLYSRPDGNAPSIAKFETDGAPVKGFGRNGLARLPHGFQASSFTVDPDGGVTVLGAVRENRRMAAYRMTAAGRPARGFGHHGLATIRFGRAAESRAFVGVPRPDGGIVVAGLAGDRLAVAELGPRGHLRRGFGRDGLLTCGCGRARPTKIDLVVHRGKIYVLDHWVGPGLEGNTLVGVTAAGRLDRSFAGHGQRAVRAGGPIALFARGSRLLVVAQKALASGPAQVRAFHLDGRTDRSYGSAATVVTGEVQGIPTSRLSAALQPDGRLVLAGEKRGKKEVEGSSLELLGLR